MEIAQVVSCRVDRSTVRTYKLALADHAEGDSVLARRKFGRPIQKRHHGIRRANQRELEIGSQTKFSTPLLASSELALCERVQNSLRRLTIIVELDVRPRPE